MSIVTVGRCIIITVLVVIPAAAIEDILSFGEVDRDEAEPHNFFKLSKIVLRIAGNVCLWSYINVAIILLTSSACSILGTKYSCVHIEVVTTVLTSIAFLIFGTISNLRFLIGIYWFIGIGWFFGIGWLILSLILFVLVVAFAKMFKYPNHTTEENKAVDLLWSTIICYFIFYKAIVYLMCGGIITPVTTPANNGGGSGSDVNRSVSSSQTAGQNNNTGAGNQTIGAVNIHSQIIGYFWQINIPGVNFVIFTLLIAIAIKQNDTVCDNL